MDVANIGIGNYLLHEEKWITVESVFRKSVNLEVEKLPDGVFSVKSWVPIAEVRPVQVTTPILEDLGFRYEFQRYTYRMDSNKVYILRRGERFFFAVDNERNVITELTGVHHLQNLMYFIFGVKIAVKHNRWKYFIRGRDRK